MWLFLYIRKIYLNFLLILNGVQYENNNFFRTPICKIFKNTFSVHNLSNRTLKIYVNACGDSPNIICSLWNYNNGQFSKISTFGIEKIGKFDFHRYNGCKDPNHLLFIHIHPCTFTINTRTRANAFDITK